MIHDVDRLKNIMRGSPGEGSHSKSIKNKHQRRSRSRSRTGSYGIVDPNLLPSMFEDAGGSVKEEGVREKRITSPVGRATRYGDLFGTHGSYAEGMLYRSRLGPDKNAVLAVRKGSPGLARLARQSDGARAIASKNTTGISPEERNNEESFKAVFRTKVGSKSSDLGSHRDAANAVLSVVFNPDLQPLLVRDGLLPAIQAMLAHTKDDKVKFALARAVCILCHNKDLDVELLDQGVLEILVHFLKMSQAAASGAVRKNEQTAEQIEKDILMCNAASSIVNLSCASIPVEDDIVRGGALSELHACGPRCRIPRFSENLISRVCKSIESSLLE